MKYLIAVACLCLASCAGVPLEFGIKTNGLEAQYSPKGGLTVSAVVEPAK